MSPRQQPQASQPLPPLELQDKAVSEQQHGVTLYSPPPTKAFNSYSMLRLCQITCTKLDLGSKYPGKVIRLQVSLKKHKKTILKSPIIDNISDTQTSFVFTMNHVFNIPYVHHVRVCPYQL